MARVKQRVRRGSFTRSDSMRSGSKRSGASTKKLSPPFKKARISRSTNRDNTIQIQKYKRGLDAIKRGLAAIKELHVELDFDLKKHQNIRNKVKKVIIF